MVVGRARSLRSVGGLHQRQELRRLRRRCPPALLRSAVERQLEIIGEALRVAVQHRPDLVTQITDVPAIIAFRNQLTHAYSAIDRRTVWGVLERRVPLLRSEVEPLLQSLQAE